MSSGCGGAGAAGEPPCSNVGPIFRDFLPVLHPRGQSQDQHGPDGGGVDGRLQAVLLHAQSELRVRTGDLRTDSQTLSRLQCKSFRWFGNRLPPQYMDEQAIAKGKNKEHVKDKLFPLRPTERTMAAKYSPTLRSVPVPRHLQDSQYYTVSRKGEHLERVHACANSKDNRVRMEGCNEATLHQEMGDYSNGQIKVIDQDLAWPPGTPATPA